MRIFMVYMYDDGYCIKPVDFDLVHVHPLTLLCFTFDYRCGHL